MTLQYPIPDTSLAISRMSTSLLFISITITIFAEILKKISNSKLVLQDSNNKKQPVKTFKLLFSTCCLILTEAFTVFAFFHFLFMGDALKKDNPPPKLRFFSVYMSYLFCMGFVIPCILIISVDNMRKYVCKSIMTFWTTLKQFGERCVKHNRAKVVPNFETQ